jgi:hypothetical protein
VICGHAPASSATLADSGEFLDWRGDRLAW